VTDWKTYARRFPDTVKARQLGTDEIVYDAQGRDVPHQPGDMLIEASGARLVIDSVIFRSIYVEIPDGNEGNKDLPSTQPANV
jgi:hypothetical protein